MAPVVPNRNWPTLFAEGDFGGNPFYQAGGTPIYTSMSPRLYKQWSVRRGKQFELDAVQAGEFHGQWVNQDGALDPTNTTSYYSPGVLPYRGYRIRAQYPPSVNLLNGDTATGGEVSPLSVGTAGSTVGVLGSFPFSVVASGTAWQGTQVWQATGPFLANTTLFYLFPVPVVAVLGTSYTFSVRVRSVSTGINPVVYPQFSWINPSGSAVSSVAGGTVALTGGPTAAWTTVTFTSTVPGPTAGLFPVALQPMIVLSGTAPGSMSFQVDGVQLEQATAASTFSIPGKNYPVFSGLIERYPQSWDFTGTYGVVTPVCVDTMALLSQTILKEAFVMDVVATAPAWFFQLNEASPSAGAALTFNEQAGRTPAAGVFSSSNGAGTLNSGTSITAADLVNGKFFGTNGPVITVTNPTANQGTVVDLTQAGITGPPSSGGWTRMVAFRTSVTSGTPVMAAATAGFSPGVVGFNSNWYLQLQNAPFMNAAVSMYTDSGVQNGLVHTAVVNDNNWHLAVFSLSASGQTLSLYVDGVQAQTTVGTDMHASLTANDGLGGDEYKAAGLVGFGNASWQGDLALYAQWNYEMNSTVVSNLYTSWRFAWLGDTSDQRYGRILGWAGYAGAQNLDSGVTTTMGPANDVSGSDALTCLQNVVNTENGRHFVGSDGTINFQSRARFFQASTPVWTFGENQGSGEIPYVDLSFDFDPTRVSNSVAVTEVSTGQTYYANDTTSQSNYGIRSLSRSNQSNFPEEVRESAFFFLSRYKDPHVRVQLLKVDVSANPALWPSVLAFELGQYVKINRRDPFGVRPIISQFGFLEQITHTPDDKGKWFVELQISATPTTPYGTFTSLRTTLFSSASSGQPVITISPLPDAATNPVRSELTGGQTLLITGGGNSEFGTVSTGGVQNQAAGYTSANITLTGNLSHTYPAGSTVVEATGANYDTLAVFDQVQFAY